MEAGDANRTLPHPGPWARSIPDRASSRAMFPGLWQVLHVSYSHGETVGERSLTQ